MSDVLKIEDMDIVGELFGVRLVKHNGPGVLIELYIEDDENYHYKCTFNDYWLDDLAAVLKATQFKTKK